jgi:hypothetical protein
VFKFYISAIATTQLKIPHAFITSHHAHSLDVMS